MRSDIITVKASQLKAGDILCYNVPSQDTLIEEVKIGVGNEIEVISGNDTAIQWFKPNETVWIKKQ